MPLPIGVDPNHLDPKAGTFSAASVIKKLEQMGVKLGKGSSRVVFLVNVEASQFDPAILKKYNYHPEGMVETAIKLAINPKGIAQNRSEIDHDDYTGGNQFLLPILDNSQHNKGMSVDEESLANWIQMPVAPKPKPSEFKKNINMMFGNKIYDVFTWTRKASNLRDLDEYDYEISNQQKENIEDFVDLLEELGIGIGDLVRPANWGMWNGKMYIVDYGFDGSTKGFYDGTQKALAFVDREGNITMRTQKLAPRNRW